MPARPFPRIGARADRDNDSGEWRGGRGARRASSRIAQYSGIWTKLITVEWEVYEVWHKTTWQKVYGVALRKRVRQHNARHRKGPDIRCWASVQEAARWFLDWETAVRDGLPRWEMEMKSWEGSRRAQMECSLTGWITGGIWQEVTLGCVTEL